MEFWDMYWITRLDELKESLDNWIPLFMVLGVFSLAPAFLMLMDETDGYSSKKFEKYYKYRKVFISIGIVFFMSAGMASVLGRLTPTTNQFLAIKGIEIVTAEGGKASVTLDKAWELLNKEIDKKLEDVK